MAKTETHAEDQTQEQVQAEAPVENLPSALVEQVEGSTDSEDAPASSGEGIRARKAFMLKQMIPNPDWINTNIVAKGKGTRVTVGRIFGVAMGYEDKVNTLPNGELSESIVLKGVFQSESYLTGELSEASNVYFPMAYAEKVKALFLANPDIKIIEVDTDIGLEATGKTIPYEWVISAFIEGEEMAVLKRLRTSRQRPATAPVLTGSAPAAIADQSNNG